MMMMMMIAENRDNITYYLHDNAHYDVICPKVRNCSQTGALAVLNSSLIGRTASILQQNKYVKVCYTWLLRSSARVIILSKHHQRLSLLCSTIPLFPHRSTRIG